MNGANWIDFGSANEFQESMQHSQQLNQNPHDDESSIPIGSDVDLGAPLTDLDDFSARQDLDSEWVDDLSALERMKELLGQEISLRTVKFLSGQPKRTSMSSCLSDDDDDDSIQIDMHNGRPMSTARSMLQSSRSSNMTASTAPMDSEKSGKSKKSSKEGKKKKKEKKEKKKKKSRSRDGDHSDSGDDGYVTYHPLGESEGVDPCDFLDAFDTNKDNFDRPVRKAF